MEIIVPSKVHRLLVHFHDPTFPSPMIIDKLELIVS